MRFQCPFCFTIIPVRDEPATPQSRVTCPNCSKSVALPKSRFDTGCVISDFVIEDVIGHGGMATVYLARQLSLDRHVALKILKPRAKATEGERSLLREAKAAARLNHPNLVQALAVGNDDGVIFYAMEYVKGETLDARIRREKTVGFELALNIAQQAAEALHAAWTQVSLIHRDIKPDNIMLAEDGYAKVMDLGISVTVQEAADAQICGTPAFMAPEQFLQKGLDCRTDIYSLGMTLYNTIAGYAPFDGTETEEIVRQHLYQELKMPDPALVHVPPRIARLILRMTAKDPADRFQDYEQLLAEIVEIRRRLAPQSDLVPSVHTITFSKYRMPDDQEQSTPSEIYRKRSEKRKKVAEAREKQRNTPAAPPVGRPLFTPLRVISLAGLVALILILLVIVLQMGSPSPPGTFADDVRQFLLVAGESPGSPADLADLQTQGRALAASFPVDHRPVDLHAYLRLQEYLTDLTLRRDRARREADSGTQFRLFEQRLRQQETDLGRLAEDFTGLTELQDDLAAREQRLNLLGERLQSQVFQLEERLAEVNAIRQDLEEQQRRLEPRYRYALQLRVVDLFRGGRLEELPELLAAAPADPEALAAFKARLRQQVATATDLYYQVADSGLRLAGRTFELGVVQSVNGTRMNLRAPDGELLAVSLADLQTSHFVTLATDSPAETGPRERQRYPFALCWGDFALARQLARGDEAELLKDLMTGCFEARVAEVRANLLAGNRSLAAARARRWLALYDGLPEFEPMGRELRDLFRSRPAEPESTSAEVRP